MAKGDFVRRVYAERGGKAADPNFDVQAGRGARNMPRNLLKGITRALGFDLKQQKAPK